MSFQYLKNNLQMNALGRSFAGKMLMKKGNKAAAWKPFLSQLYVL